MSILILRNSSGGGGGIGALQADYAARIGAAGVVWHHDFQNSAEVTNFLYPGTDTSEVFHDTSVGITGGSIRCRVPAGSLCNGGWHRNFSPLFGAGNGRGVDDPALGGTLTKRVWTPSSSALGNWADGYYGHADYLSHPVRGDGGSNGFRYDNIPGSDFYIQALVMKSSSRFLSGQPDGKLLMIFTTGDGPIVGSHQPQTANQELVVMSMQRRFFYAYTNRGSRSNSQITNPQSGGGPFSYNPGGAFDATCVTNNTTPSTCWPYEGGRWAALLIRIIPGHDGGGGNDPPMPGDISVRDTGVQVWAAHQGETSYTKIWDKTDYVWSFGELDPWPFAFNCIAFNAFMNDQPARSDIGFDQWLGQMIFSRQPIACPQVWPA